MKGRGFFSLLLWFISVKDKEKNVGTISVIILGGIKR